MTSRLKIERKFERWMSPKYPSPNFESIRKIKHITGCKNCGNIIFDGTPGEIYTAEKHEEECKNFEYQDLFQCSNCQNISGSETDICDCE